MLFDVLLQGGIPALGVLLGFGVQSVFLDGSLFHDEQHNVDGVAMLDFCVSCDLDRASGLHVLLARRLVLPHLQTERLQSGIAVHGSCGTFGVKCELAGAAGCVDGVRLDGESAAEMTEEW